MKRGNSVNKLSTLPRESFLRVGIWLKFFLTTCSSKKQNWHPITKDFLTNEVTHSSVIFSQFRTYFANMENSLVCFERSSVVLRSKPKESS
jgi:hypothetical protein